MTRTETLVDGKLAKTALSTDSITVILDEGKSLEIRVPGSYVVVHAKVVPTLIGMMRELRLIV